MKKKISIILILLTSIFLSLFLSFSFIKIKAEENIDVTKIESYNIRDDYVIFSEDQDNFGLCWSFATNKVIEITILKKTNQLFNFSEAYNALPNKVAFGSAGNYNIIYNVLSNENKGLLLEQDFEYLFSLYFLSNANQEIYENEIKKYKLDEFNNLFSTKILGLSQQYKRESDIKKIYKKQKSIFINMAQFT